MYSHDLDLDCNGKVDFNTLWKAIQKQMLEITNIMVSFTPESSLLYWWLTFRFSNLVAETISTLLGAAY